MLELLVVPALTSAASQMVKALVSGRDVGGEDVVSVATSVLEAVLSTQQRTNDALARLEGKVDKLLVAPYLAGMSAGTRLMGDAAAAHRSRGHRAQMLAEARTQFLIAHGYAPDAVLRAQCEAYYGLAWLADGSVQDAVLALGRAARVLEEELLVTRSLAVDEWTKVQQRRADGPAVNMIRGFFTSGDAQLNSDVAGARFVEALHEHSALQRLRVAIGWGRAGFPVTTDGLRVRQLHPASALIFTCDPAPPAAPPYGALGVVVDPEVTVWGPGERTVTVRVTNHRDEPLLYGVDEGGMVYMSWPLVAKAHWQIPFEYGATFVTVPPGATEGSFHEISSPYFFDSRNLPGFSATHLNEVMVNVRLSEDGPYVRFAATARTETVDIP